MIAAVPVSGQVRAAIEDALVLGFNTGFAAACQAAGIEACAFNWPRDPQGVPNCYLGDRTLGQLVALDEPELPAVAWWIGAGQDLNRTKARAFSGVVQAHWRFFLAVRGKHVRRLAILRECVEAALMGVLLGGLDVAGIAYRKDLSWDNPIEQEWLDLDQQHVGWVQEVTYSAGFEVNL
jgi:hypothetical protein